MSIDFFADFAGHIWETPGDYGGFSPEGDIIVYARNRDSEVMVNSNYERILEDLIAARNEHCPDATYVPAGCDPDDENDHFPMVYDWRAGHWACGWVEYITVSRFAPEPVLTLASEVIGALQEYPIYDEEHYSQKQDDEITSYWERISLRERTDYVDTDVDSLFSIRRGDSIPESAYEGLREAFA